jgi:hypothetical protein
MDTTSNILIFNQTTLANLMAEPQTKEHHEPHRLVCIQLLCPYPGCGKVRDGISLECISMYFGLRCCENHQQNARADCAKWMRKNGRLQLSQGFLKEMELLGKMFSVTRSNGEVQNDWTIHTPSDSFSRAELAKMPDGQWGVTMYKALSANEGITKCVPLNSLGLEWLEEYISKIPENEYIIKRSMAGVATER